MENTLTELTVFENFKFFSIDDEIYVIRKLHAKNIWPFELKNGATREDTEPHAELRDLLFNFAKVKIGLLVGMNVSELLKPVSIVNTPPKGPYAS